MLGFGYPGGPIIEKLAKNGDENSYNFPIPLKQSPKIEFSYSGLKNAVRLAILKEKENNNFTDITIANIAASFQKVAIEHIIMKLKKYLKTNTIQNFAIVGGASANIYLRTKLEKLLSNYNANLLLTELKYCSDNAAMIGRVALEYL